MNCPLQISIALRIESILFTDLKKVWEYNLQNRSFYEIDLQEKIQDIFNGIPISHSFKNAVMDFLPLLKSHYEKEIIDKFMKETYSPLTFFHIFSLMYILEINNI